MVISCLRSNRKKIGLKPQVYFIDTQVKNFLSSLMFYIKKDYLVDFEKKFDRGLTERRMR